MAENLDRLLSIKAGQPEYSISYSEIKDIQVAAVNERLQEQGVNIKLVALRAKDAGISEISKLEDIVPLLLPHTAYKSYPDSFIANKRWDRLTKWLGTVSAYPVDNVDLAGVEDLDGWLDACQKAGLMVSCTSGTTGKPAMLVASQKDLDFSGEDGVAAIQWATKIRPGDNRVLSGAVGGVAMTPRAKASGGAMMGAFVNFDVPVFDPGLPPITIGSLTKSILLRKAITEGTAAPEEIAQFEKEAQDKEKAIAASQEAAADDIISKRNHRLYITGMWAQLFSLAELVRSKGYSADDFHPENAVFLAGGLKGKKLPPDYKQFVFETFNLNPDYIYQMYGMQEINSSMPKCREGRYHIPPWLVCLPLDKSGEHLVDGVGKGSVEGRAAFFDLSLDGRWGGIISGDHIEINYEPCSCGSASPSIADNISRYSDLEGDDKIACSGTTDAYVRGLTSD